MKTERVAIKWEVGGRFIQTKGRGISRDRPGEIDTLGVICICSDDPPVLFTEQFFLRRGKGRRN